MVKWSTTLATRRGRGRTYFCGLNAGHFDTTDKDSIASSVVTNMQTRATAWIGAWISDPTWAFVVYSYAGAAEDEVRPYSVVSGASAQTRVAIQKRRSPGR
jgi:hypothetical protein